MASFSLYWLSGSGDMTAYFPLARARVQAFLEIICLSMESFNDSFIHP